MPELENEFQESIINFRPVILTIIFFGKKCEIMTSCFQFHICETLHIFCHFKQLDRQECTLLHDYSVMIKYICEVHQNPYLTTYCPNIFLSGASEEKKNST